MSVSGLSFKNPDVSSRASSTPSMMRSPTSSNAVSLSPGGPPPQSSETTAEEVEDEARLRSVVEGMERAQKVADKMVIILEQFEERLQEMENSVVPIHKVTSEMRTVHGNLGSAIGSVDVVLGNFEVADELTEAVNTGPLAGRLAEYLQHISRIKKTIKFFRANSNFKSARSTLKALVHLQNVCISKCSNLFIQLLQDCSEPINVKKVELQLVTEERRQELEMLVGVLLNFDGNCAKEYGEARSLFLLHSMSAMRVHENQDYETQGQEFVAMLDMLVRMVEQERSIALQVFPPELFEGVLEDTLTPAIEQFMKISEQVIKGSGKAAKEESQVEKLFVLLDVYEFVGSRLRPLNMAVKLGSNRFNDELEALIGLFRNEVKRALTDFEEYVHKNNVKVGADGNVHPLSSTTLNYLKRLLPKRTQLEFLVSNWHEQDTITLSFIVFTLLAALRNNLQNKARREQKKQPILANIFLLNNYHYILHTVKNSDLLSQELLPTFVAEYEKAIYKEIAVYRQSWNVAIEWLLDINVKGKDSGNDYSAIKKKFNGFNRAIERLFHSQKLFTIANNNLREQLRADTKRDVIPLYTSFIERYRDVPFSQNRSKYERYSPATLDSMLSQFFED